MVRILIFFLFVNIAFADILGTVRTFINSKTYRENKSLITSLFKDESKFKTPSGQIDSVAIADTLREHGLLTMSYEEQKVQAITFDVVNNPLLSMRIITNILEELGYSSFLTKDISRSGDKLSWTIHVNTQNILDPKSLSTKLKLRHCQITKLRKTSSLHWTYGINAKYAKLKTISILKGERKSLTRPNGAYWIDVHNMKEAQIAAHAGDSWFAKITFFNARLNVVEEKSYDKKQNSLNIKIPANAYYMRLDDKFTLQNIKRGLAVRLY